MTTSSGEPTPSDDPDDRGTAGGGGATGEPAGSEHVPPRPDSAPPPPPPPPLPGHVPGQQPGHAPGQPPGQQPGVSAYGSQPQGGHPGAQPAVGGHPHPGQRSFAQGPMGVLAQGVTWRTALAPAGIALLAGVVVSVVLSALLTSMGDLSSVMEEMGMSGGAIGYALPFILLGLGLGGSGVVRMNAGYEGVVGLEGAMHIVGAPLLISIVTVGLLWWLTKRSEAKSPSPHRAATWLRIGITTLAFTLVVFLLQLVFAARMSIAEQGGAASLEFSAVTVRTFFLPLLVVLVTTVWARAAGHFKGTEAIGAPFLRWVIPPGLVALVHAAVNVAVFAVIALFVLPLAWDMPWQTVPLLFVNAGVILTSIVHLGGVSATAEGALAEFTDGVATTVTLFSDSTPGLLWLGLLVVVLSVLLSTLVSTVTRRPHWSVIGDDTQQWSSAWRTPLAFLVLWGLLSLVVLPIRVTMVGSGELMEELGGTGGLRAGIGALPWSFLLFAVWGGVIEVLSRTLGPRLVMSVPALAKLLAGRAIHPYWGQALHMNEPRGALVHPDIVAEMAARAQAAPPAHGSVAPGTYPGPAGTHPGPVGTHPGTLGTHPGPAGAQGVQAAAPAYGSPPPPPGYPAVGSPPAPIQQGPQDSGPYAPTAHGHGSAGPVGPGAPVQPFDKRKATIVGVVAGALVVALVGGAIVVTQLNSRMFGPEAVAEKYFSELSDGDADGALRLADVNVPAEQRTLLTNDVLSAAAALPQDVSIEDSEVSDGTASVDVSYDIGGSKNSVTLTLRKTGKKAVFFDDWRLQAPDLHSLSVGAPGLDTVKVNGIDVPTGEGGVELPAFPALYTVGLAEASEFVEAAEVQSRVFFTGADDGGDGEPAALVAEPTDAFRSEVDSQVKTLIDTCAAKTDAEPDGCPFASSEASYRDDVGNIVWSVESYPSVTVSGADSYGDYYGDSSQGDGGESAWSVTSDTAGEALVTGTYKDYFDDTETFDESVSIGIGGTAEIVDGKVVVNIDSDSSGYY